MVSSHITLSMYPCTNNHRKAVPNRYFNYLRLFHTLTEMLMHKEISVCTHISVDSSAPHVFCYSAFGNNIRKINKTYLHFRGSRNSS